MSAAFPHGNPVLHKSKFLTLLDLLEAYLHILILREHQCYLHFAVPMGYFQFWALLFGLVTAPRTFMRVMVVMIVALCREVVLVHPYLNDWLI